MAIRGKAPARRVASLSPRRRYGFGRVGRGIRERAPRPPLLDWAAKKTPKVLEEFLLNTLVSCSYDLLWS